MPSYPGGTGERERSIRDMDAARAREREDQRALLSAVPISRRRRAGIALTPWLIAAGIVMTLLASLAVNWRVDPFRGQPLAPSPAAVEGSTPPAIALPPVPSAGTTSRTRPNSSGSRRARRAITRARRAASRARARERSRAARPSG